jgi:hypothetical protein
MLDLMGENGTAKICWGAWFSRYRVVQSRTASKASMEDPTGAKFIESKDSQIRLLPGYKYSVSRDGYAPVPGLACNCGREGHTEAGPN